MSAQARLNILRLQLVIVGVPPAHLAGIRPRHRILSLERHEPGADRNHEDAEAVHRREPLAEEADAGERHQRDAQLVERAPRAASPSRARAAAVWWRGP